MKDNTTGALVFGGVLTMVLLLIFSPIITFWAGYFGGWILSKFVGDYIVSGFNLLLGRDVITISFLPIFCGSLAVIGSYFKSTQTNNNK